MNQKKVTILDLQEKKQKGQRITMLAAYDYPTARLVDQAGIDIILVGDSVGMVLLGYEHTVPVTMGEMLHYCRAVARGAKHTLLVGDMPFLSYQVDVKEAIRNAGRFLRGDMDVVSWKAGARSRHAKAIVDAGIGDGPHRSDAPDDLQTGRLPGPGEGRRHSQKPYR
jgi:3-methyl-2-oxobutanoate hydroxymethyltransferase